MTNRGRRTRGGELKFTRSTTVGKGEKKKEEEERREEREEKERKGRVRIRVN